ncbi:hypothetical protein BpHYR1_027723, partial [Brachionus plicatilis]
DLITINPKSVNCDFELAAINAVIIFRNSQINYNRFNRRSEAFNLFLEIKFKRRKRGDLIQMYKCSQRYGKYKFNKWN